MVQIRSFPLISLLLFSTFTNAWHIDADCQGEKRKFVEAALDNAFQLNNYAGAALGSSRAEHLQIVEWLFGTDAGTRERLNEKLNFISDLNRPDRAKQSKEQAGVDDFVVHCTLDRIKTRKWKLKERYFDEEFNQNLKGREIATQQCTDVVVAYIAYPKPDENGNYPGAHYNILQICPRFLDYVMKRDPKFQNAIPQSKMWGLLEKIGEWAVKTIYTPVDMVTLLDKVLLHEISHTTGAGETYDVGGMSGYGWKNCRKLSAVVTVLAPDDAEYDDPLVKGPEQNADSIALFGSVSRMLIDGATINEDGTFIARAAERIKRIVADFRASSPFHRK